MGFTRTVKTVGFCLVLLAAVLALSAVQVNAATGTIFSDAEDGYVNSLGGGSRTGKSLVVGDSGHDEFRAFVKFSLAGISGTDLSSATLNLYLNSSIHDGWGDYDNPLTNPGLGFCVVRHIDDYGTLDHTDFNAASIGNDPGTLLTDTVTPDKGYVSLDVRPAMQDDIDNARSFSSFMIYLTANMDNDDKWDAWLFFASEQPETAADPYIEYGPAPVTVTSTVTTTETSVSSVTSYVATVPPTELYYDDGTAETHPTLDTDIWLGDNVAVRFSLESSMLPADLVGVKFYAQQGGSAPIYIYRNLPDTGCGSTDILANFYMNFNDNTWSEQALTGVTATGDFCVVVEYPFVPIDSPPEIGLDTSSTDNGHSWVFYAGDGFWRHIGDTPIGNGNLMIRAVFETAAAGPTTVTSYVTSVSTSFVSTTLTETSTSVSATTEYVTSATTEYVTSATTEYVTSATTEYVTSATTEYVTSIMTSVSTEHVTDTVTSTIYTTSTSATTTSTKPTYTLTVKVNSGWFRPVAGATVTLDGVQVGTTDAYGNLVIQGVSAGSHRLVITKAGYKDYTTTVNITWNKTVTVTLSRI